MWPLDPVTLLSRTELAGPGWRPVASAASV